ncbi:MAG: porin family protein [Bdellovibrionales bacterium]|nr:porin family protein [Bdellovibrionales bacterium]
MKTKLLAKQVLTAGLSVFCAGSLLMSPVTAKAADEGQFRLGAQAGHVGLLNDVGSRVSNGIGLGAFAGYHASSDMMLDLGYLTSKHDDLKHSEVNIGMGYYVGGYDMLYPHILAGVVFANNSFVDDSLPLSRVDVTSSAFGLYAGMGFDFEIGKNLNMGLVLRYNKLFETSVRLAAGSTRAAVQDNVLALFRIGLLL